MAEAITPEQLIEQGKVFKELLLPLLTMEEIEVVLRDTPYTQRIREEGREEGHEAMIKTITRILTVRFAVELDHFTPAFKPLPLSTLETLSEIALTVDSLVDFEAGLAKLTGQE